MDSVAENPNKKFWTTLLEDITAMRDETILVESLSNMTKVEGDLLVEKSTWPKTLWGEFASMKGNM